MIENSQEIEVVGLASDGTRLIKNAFPAIKVLILTTFEDNKNIAAAMGNGADGYNQGHPSVCEILSKLMLKDKIQLAVFAIKNKIV